MEGRGFKAAINVTVLDSFIFFIKYNRDLKNL